MLINDYQFTVDKTTKSPATGDDFSLNLFHVCSVVSDD
jgi:hypothetical protein